jgi:hypothetical protein
MDTRAFKKVRKIEIKTRRLSDHIFSGEYHTSFKGRGMTLVKYDNTNMEMIFVLLIGT